MRTGSIIALTLAAVVLAGCSARMDLMDDETLDAFAGPPIPNTFGLNRIALTGSGVLNFEGTDKTYSVMYGPRPGTSETFSGWLEPQTNTVYVEAGYAYVVGQLPTQTFPASPPGPGPAAMIVIWPVVKTKNIRAAATGTILVVEADGTSDAVFRLKPSNSKAVRVDRGSESQVIPATEPDVKVIRNSTLGLSPPDALTTDEQDFIDQVVAAAAAAGLPVP